MRGAHEKGYFRLQETSKGNARGVGRWSATTRSSQKKIMFFSLFWRTMQERRAINACSRGLERTGEG